MIIEWNHHLFSGNTAHYPFHPRAVYVPEVTHLAEDPLTGYLTHMQHVGIDRAVVVQPEPYGDDHRLVLDCLRRAPDQLRATALFYPRDNDAPLKLAALVKQEPHIVAVRFHMHRGKEMYLDSFADAGVRNLWKAAADLDITVELHIGPNYARQAGEAIAAFPRVPVLIDHLAEAGLWQRGRICPCAGAGALRQRIDETLGRATLLRRSPSLCQRKTVCATRGR